MSKIQRLSLQKKDIIDKNKNQKLQNSMNHLKSDRLVIISFKYFLLSITALKSV